MLYYLNDFTFLKIDLLLALKYLFKNPHRVSRDFLKQLGESNIYAYGETPLTTLDFIAQKCKILSTDVVYELGCGTGRSCFWLNQFVKCQVFGIDYNPKLIDKAIAVKKTLFLPSVHFIHQDILETPFHAATVIYLYGICFEDQMIQKLVNQFIKLSSGTKIITISYPLTDYDDLNDFYVADTFQVRFPWGRAYAFLNIKS